jgi:hypothetical protein
MKCYTSKDVKINLVGIELDIPSNTEFIGINSDPQFQPTRRESHFEFPEYTLPAAYADRIYSIDCVRVGGVFQHWARFRFV